jgi:hypothetical protein
MPRRPTKDEINESFNVLRDEARKHHVSPQRLAYLEKLAMVESGGSQVGADGSKAFGMFQVTPDTWNDDAKEFGLERTDSSKGDGRHDLRQQAIFAIKSTEKNEVILSRSLNRPPDDGELYLMHFAGRTAGKRAIDLAKIDPNTPIKHALSQNAIDSNSYKSETNKGVRINFKDGGFLPIENFKVGDLVNWASGKMGLPDDKYKTNSSPQYKRDKGGVPDSQGNWVMVAIAAVAAVVVAAVAMFSDDDDGNLKSPNTPRRPRGHSPSPA